MSFKLPEDYEVPKSPSRYFTFEQGDNVFRILGDVVLGWEDWIDNKPVRVKYTDPKPEPVNPEKPIKHFWAFPVWDYRDSSIKILEITQSTIQGEIANLYNDKDWGIPTDYDINVKRKGEKLDTKYSVIAKPPKPLDTAIQGEWNNTEIDLQKLFTGDDPFSVDETTSNSEEKIPTITDEEDINGEPPF